MINGKCDICRMDLNLRKFENYHIVLWLVKDLCWAMEWKKLGIFMIIPTVFLAFYITIKSLRGDRFEFWHNVAVCFWICANATWMTGEFFGWDEQARSIAAALFVPGIVIIAFSYLQRNFVSKQKAV